MRHGRRAGSPRLLLRLGERTLYRHGAEDVSACYPFDRERNRWKGVQEEPTTGGAAFVVRSILVGGCGESCLFQLRYFQVAPGGRSAVEKHGHEHVLIGVRGKGKVVVHERTYELRPLDVVYIAPRDAHQLLNDGDTPFGFFCIVNAEGNRTAATVEDELAWLQSGAPEPAPLQ